MRLDSAPALHLGYCTNVHPGEALADVRHTLETDVCAVRDRVAPGRPFGLGLRLGNDAATTLATDAAARADFVAQLERDALYVFTVNGFPYGDFAAQRVKAEVYRPDWRDPERRAYTRRVAEVLAALPGPGTRTISTVAGGFKPETASPEDRRALVAGLLGSAQDLAEIADRTGVSIRLCLEPEPFTTLETTAEVIELFTRDLLPSGEAARRHLGLCYDCCHQAVQFEDPVESLRALAAAGVPIGKVQVSSALVLPHPADPEARAALFDFIEPRFLHQVVGRFAGAGALRRAVDLPEVRADAAAWALAESWRCHFHVPIGWAGGERLSTTRADWQAAVRHAAATGLTTHFEVETYTWGVLPAAERSAHLAAAGGGLTAALADELRALIDVLTPPA
jgi:hypothetical protein